MTPRLLSKAQLFGIFSIKWKVGIILLPIILGLILTHILLSEDIKADNVQVLLIWDVNNTHTQALKTALESAGIDVTLSETSEIDYTGANPSPVSFDVVIHLNGTTYATEMPLSGQNALVSFVQNGGGYVGAEWNAYEIDVLDRMLAMRDLTLFDREGGTTADIGDVQLTYSDVPAMSNHPILANVPSSFSLYGYRNIGPVHTFVVNPATVLMRSAGGGIPTVSDGVAIREFGLG